MERHLHRLGLASSLQHEEGHGVNTSALTGERFCLSFCMRDQRNTTAVCGPSAWHILNRGATPSFGIVVEAKEAVSGSHTDRAAR